MITAGQVFKGKPVFGPEPGHFAAERTPEAAARQEDEGVATGAARAILPRRAPDYGADERPTPRSAEISPFNRRPTKSPGGRGRVKNPGNGTEHSCTRQQIDSIQP